MKKIIFIGFALFAVVLLLLAAVPFFFKDKIFDLLDEELANTVNAQVYYDREEIGLSVFRSFPQLSATMGDFGVKGHPPFQQDTLIHVGYLQVDIDIWSVLFDDNPSLKGVHLEDGQIYVKVLEDGQANYDIAKEGGEELDQSAGDSSSFQLGVDFIEVNNLDLIYDDRSLDYLMVLSDMNLQGSGDLTMDVYDLMVSGYAQVVNVTYEGVEYLSDKVLTLDSKVNVDLEKMRFSAKDALLKFNEFGFEIEGYLAMPEDDIEMDLAFSGENNDFKSVLSLVPGIYSDSFDNLTTSGEMDFAGTVNGVYNETDFPGFQFALTVNDGMFQFPDLPRPVQHVNLDLEVINTTGNFDLTTIDLSRFSLEFGNQPVLGRFYLKDLVSYEMDAGLKGNINLLELTSIFPMEGLELKGKLSLDMSAKGRYDSAAQIIPSINAQIGLDDGYIKTSEYPAPIEQINFRAEASNATGRMRDLNLDVPSFGFKLEDEAVTGSLKVSDLEDLNYDFSLHGAVDLAKMASVLPLENTRLEGRIQADIDTRGSYEAIKNNRFAQLETSGEMQINNFYFADEDYPQGVRIHEALSDFSPQSINLTKFDARLGESPVQASGSLSDYMAYLFGEDAESLKGNLDVYSSNFNVNEWMTASDSADEDTTSLEVVSLPQDIDFTMSVKADRIIYDNLSLADASGVLRLKEGVLNLEGFKTHTLGGSLGFDGTYNSKDLTHPTFDMQLDISGLGIQEAFQSFVTVKAFAPIAQHVIGNFSTTFSFSGLLGQDMMPVLSSLDGKGLIGVTETAVRDSPLIQGIANLTKLNDAAALRLKPLNISAEIVDGMLNVAPFELQLWDYPTKIQGSTGFDGRINYLVSVDVPASKFGSQVNSLVAGFAGTDLSTTTIPLAITVGGTYGSPNISLATSESLDSYVSNALKSRLSGEKENAQEKIAADFKAREDSLKQEVKQKAEVARDSVEKEATKLVEETKEKAVDEVKNLLRGFTNRKKPAEEAKPDPE